MSESAVVDTGTSSGWGRALSIGGLVPRYGALDGTWIASALLPLYFGVVYGDVGAGLIMLAIVSAVGMALRSRPKARLVTGVLGRAAVVAIIFGFLYGEFFGRSFGPVPLSRVDTVSGFVTVAPVFLVAQLTASLVAGVLWSTGDRRRDDAWAPAAHFAVFAVAAFVAIAVAGLLGTLIGNAADFIAGWLAIEAVPDVVVLAIFYLLGAVWLAGAALLADVTLEHLDG